MEAKVASTEVDNGLLEFTSTYLYCYCYLFYLSAVYLFIQQQRWRFRISKKTSWSLFDWFNRSINYCPITTALLFKYCPLVLLCLFVGFIRCSALWCWS